MKRSNPSSLLTGLPEAAEILIVRLRSIGDVVLLTPSLAALHAWRPDLRLRVLVEPGCAAILEGNPAVAEIIVSRGFFGTVRQLRRYRWAVAYNQHSGPTSAILTAASGAPLRVCWEGRQYSFLYNVSVAPADRVMGRSHLHTVEQQIAQFYWTGLPRGPIPPTTVYPNRGELSAMASKLAVRGIEAGQGYAVFHPGGTFFTKRWPVENLADIVRWVKEKYGLAPVVVLGPADGDVAAGVRQWLGPLAVIFDSLDLRELIALIAGARLYVGNDSGPLHIAAALGRRCVSIFGSSSSERWRPWETDYRLVQNDFPCNPCPGDRCYAFDEPRCILSVTVDQVRGACASILADPEATLRARPEVSRIEVGKTEERK